MNHSTNIPINIYKITNTINGKVYVGQTYRKIHTRFMEHMIDPESGVYEDVCKYGRDAFTYELLHVCQSQYADQWEHYYICKFNATDAEFGYNKIDEAHYRWHNGGFNPSKTEEGKKRISEYNKNHMDTITKGFVEYNESKRFPVGMLDDFGNIIKTFNSLSDACRYLEKPLCGTARIKDVCDKVKSNGKPYRFYGYGWTALDKNVQTNSVKGCKAEDELPSE